MSADTNLDISKINKQANINTAKRLGKFFGVRLIMLFITVVVGVYITILVANMGGYVDTIMKAEIKERVNMQVAAMTANKPMAPDARGELVRQMTELEEERLGLNTPFAVRSINFLKNALTLNLGRAQNMVSDHGSRAVKNILLERLPATLL